MITMGCFFSTCMLTQAPIASGAPVRLIVLTKRSQTPDDAVFGYLDETSLWAPVCLPLRGAYDDYGGVEAVAQDEAAEVLLAYLAERHGRQFNLASLTRTFTDEPHHWITSDAARGSWGARARETRSRGEPRDQYGFALIPDAIYQAALLAGGAEGGLAARWRVVMEAYRRTRTALRQRRDQAARRRATDSAPGPCISTDGPNVSTWDSVSLAEAAPLLPPRLPAALESPELHARPDDLWQSYHEVVMLFEMIPSGAYLLDRYAAEDASPALRDAICSWGVFWITLRRLHKCFQPQVVSGSQVPPRKVHQALAEALHQYLAAAAAEAVEATDDPVETNGGEA